jgi:hypothetical protein
MVQAATAEGAIAGTACAIRPQVERSDHVAGHRQEGLELVPPRHRWLFGRCIRVDMRTPPLVGILDGAFGRRSP